MSNKPKGALRLTKYNKTIGERRHESLVKQAQTFASKHFGFNKHQGSKKHNALRIMKEKY